jgi:ferrous iron transport protein B
MTLTRDSSPESPSSESRVRYVALAGNPNSGKTTVFNALTGLRHKVGNYAGVTVERKEGRLIGSEITVLDLPGTYSLNARSPDEEIARDVLLGRHPPVPELIVVVLDASNLERNLYFATQIMDLGIPVVVCLNMIDVARRMGREIDVPALERELGVPVVPTVASRGEGIKNLAHRLTQAVPPGADRRWQLPAPMQREVEGLGTLLVEERYATPEHAFFQALTLLSHTAGHDPALRSPRLRGAVHEATERLKEEGIEPDSAPVAGRYAWIEKVCAASVRQGEVTATLADRFDQIATHRVLGFVLFFGLMLLMFQAIFTWATLPMEWIEGAQNWIGGWVGDRLPEGDLQSLIVDGVIGGVGAVVVFLPQILFLFFFLGLLEDSGYMARAAFVMDRVMTRVGLHGKSFIPLLSSFACAIPAIMSTRTIEHRRDRMVTILVAPLMSCSARLPVFTLLIAGFIPAVHLWRGIGVNVNVGPVAWQANLGAISLQAAVMVGMYLLGVIAAMTMAGLLKGTLFRSEPPVFLMELPPYKVPSLRTVAAQTWERASEFLKRAGTIILAFSIILWFGMKFPGSPDQPGSERLRTSLAGRAGHLLEPVIQPFGMDWKVGIGILGSLPARELFVSTMGIVYNVDEAEDEEKQAVAVREQMRAEVHPVTGEPRFSPLSALALLVFYVLAMQCLSTLVVVRRETGHWKWPLFQWAYMSALAWGGATLVYQVGRMLGY